MKKIFLLLFSLVSMASADTYFFYLDSAFQVNAMKGILDAIAMIFGNDDYIALLRLVTLFGFAIYFIKNVVLSAAEGGGGKGLQGLAKYTLGYVALLSVVFSSGSTVVIKTTNLPTYYDGANSTTGVAVDNVPTIIAFVYSTFDRAGKGLTEMLETTYASTSDYKIGYQGYGASLRDTGSILETRFNSTDKMLGVDMEEFMTNCVFIPFSASADGKTEITNILQSSDVAGYFDNLYGSGIEINGVQASSFTTDYNGGLQECGGVWANLKSRFLVQAPSLSGTVELDQSDMQYITAGVQGVPISQAEQIVIQSAMINSIKSNSVIGTGIPSSSSFAVGATESNFILSGVGKSEFFQDMLPFLQGFLKLLLFAMFPMVVVIALLPGGYEIIKNYSKTLLWVQLWGATAAIVNFFIMLSAQDQLKAMLDGQELTYYTSSIILTEAGKWAGIAGLVYAAIPMLTWKIMTGAFSGLESLTGNMAATMDKNMSTSGTAAAAKLVQNAKTMSEQTGKDFSIGESMHYANMNQGKFEAYEQGSYMNQGENAVKNKKLSDVNQVIEDQKAQMKALGTNDYKQLMGVKSTKAERDISNTKGYNDTASNNDSTNAGIDKGLDDKSKTKMFETFGTGNIGDVKNFDNLKKNLSSLSEKDVRNQNPLGLEGGLVAEQTLKTGTDLSTLNKNMSSTGNDIDKISDIMSSSNNFELGKKEGFTNNTSYGQNKGAGAYSAASTNAQDTTVTNNGVPAVQKNEEYKQQNDIWANQAAATMQTALGGIKQNVQDNSKVKVIDDKANAMASDNNGNGTLSKNDLKDRLSTQTTEQQGNFATTKSKQQIAAELLQEKLGSDSEAQKGANKVKSTNLGTKLAKFNSADNQIKKKNEIRNDSVERKHQKIDKEAGVTDSEIALAKSLKQSKDVHEQLEKPKTEQDNIKRDMGENYGDVYNQNLEKAKEKGLTGAAAREQAAIETEKAFGGAQSGKGNKLIYDSRLEQRREEIQEKRGSIKGNPSETLKQQQDALNHYKQSGGNNEVVLANFKKNISKTQNDVNTLNSLSKQEKNLKHDVQQEMVRENRATIKNGKFNFNDFSTDNKNPMKTAEIVGTKAGEEATTVTAGGKKQTRIKNHTADKDNVSQVVNVGTGVKYTGGTDTGALVHQNVSEANEKIVDNIATGANVVKTGVEVATTVAPVLKKAKEVVKKVKEKTK